ncbi:ORF15 [Silurid herpesvirus 1]|nr:ORF15 [Silurid herpesvirus 1]
MERLGDRCAGLTTLTWLDGFGEWMRTTWTLADDPCAEYYRVLTINPILLVPPTRAIAMTVTTLFTEPLRYAGTAIGMFIRGLLGSLPVTLQLPVLLLGLLSVLVGIFGILRFGPGFIIPIIRPAKVAYTGEPVQGSITHFTEHRGEQPRRYQLGLRNRRLFKKKRNCISSSHKIC